MTSFGVVAHHQDITPPLSHQRSRRRGSRVLIDREQERQRLLAVLMGPPAVAVVGGEAGIGKSALVNSVTGDASLARKRTLRGAAHPLPERFAFGPLVEALRSVESCERSLGGAAGSLRPLLPELRHLLPPAPEPLRDLSADRHRIFRGFLELLAALGPTVCVLDDLQWADDHSVELLLFLVSQLPRELSLVLVYRPQEVDPAPCSTRSPRVSREAFRRS